MSSWLRGRSRSTSGSFLGLDLELYKVAGPSKVCLPYMSLGGGLGRPLPRCIPYAVQLSTTSQSISQ